MNGWLDGWMTNLSLKKNMHACILNDNELRERGKITLKKKTSQNKQKIPLTL